METPTTAASPEGTPAPTLDAGATQPTTSTAPEAPAPGSPEGLAQRFAAAENPKPAAPESAAKPAEANAPAPLDLSAQLETMAKQGQPFKFVAEGKEHEIRSGQHLNQLLSQGVKYGKVSRDFSELQKHVERNYGPWDKRFQDDEKFASVSEAMFNDPRLGEFLHRVINGQLTPEEAEQLGKGARLLDPTAIENAKLKRQVAETAAEKEARESQEAQAKQQEAEENDLREIEKLGFQWFSDEQKTKPTPEGAALYRELKEMVKAGEAKSMLAAFKLTEHYPRILTARKEQEAQAKAKAEADERKKRQTAIRDAEGASGGTAKPSPIAEKGSPANLIARFRAAQVAGR